MKSFAACFIVFSFCLVSFFPAQAQERYRIQVLSKYPLSQVEVQGANAWRLQLMDGNEQKGEVSQDSALSVEIWENGVRLKQARQGLPARLVELDSPTILKITAKGKQFTREFSGGLKIYNRGGQLFFVQELPLEEYVLTVLSGEMPPDSPMEALKAQAVAIRSYALTNRPRHGEEGFDFCDLTHCQVFGGRSSIAPAHRAAAEGSRGMIVTYQGKPAEVLFHSTCGGHTSPNQKVFGGQPRPYLQGVDDADYCKKSPHYEWEARLALPQIQKAVQRNTEIAIQGRVSNIVAVDREPQGRWFSLDLVGDNRVTVRLEDFLSLIGKEFGWNRLKSAWFEVQAELDEARFKGRGLGHGVGMCQEGAMGRARAGQDYRRILTDYFPGTRVERRP